MESSNRAASSSSFLLLLLFLFASLPCWKPAAAAAASGRRAPTSCNETADAGSRCGVEEEEEHAEEFQFDSEINRRLLAGSGTSGIDYGALNKDKPTCYSADGKPYNCAAKSPNGGGGGGGRTCNVDYYRC